jgi:hypothetical protein
LWISGKTSEFTGDSLKFTQTLGVVISTDCDFSEDKRVLLKSSKFHFASPTGEFHVESEFTKMNSEVSQIEADQLKLHSTEKTVLSSDTDVAIQGDSRVDLNPCDSSRLDFDEIDDVSTTPLDAEIPDSIRAEVDLLEVFNDAINNLKETKLEERKEDCG